MRRSPAQKIVETVAGVRCPCGHLDDRHKRPDPNFRVGQLIEIRGACRDCGCRGEVGESRKPTQTDTSAQVNDSEEDR